MCVGIFETMFLIENGGVAQRCVNPPLSKNEVHVDSVKYVPRCAYAP